MIFIITENRAKPAYTVTVRDRNFSVAGKFRLCRYFKYGHRDARSFGM